VNIADEQDGAIGDGIIDGVAIADVGTIAGVGMSVVGVSVVDIGTAGAKETGPRTNTSSRGLPQKRKLRLVAFPQPRVAIRIQLL
jgi:hypothetical protein